MDAVDITICLMIYEKKKIEDLKKVVSTKALWITLKRGDLDFLFKVYWKD